MVSGVLEFLIPNEVISSLYQFHEESYGLKDPTLFETITISIGTVLMLVSVVGMLMFWKPSRIIFIGSYIFMLPGYFFGAPFIYSPLSQVLYDLGMIGSGVILAVMFLEPINGIFNNNSNKALK